MKTPNLACPLSFLLSSSLVLAAPKPAKPQSQLTPEAAKLQIQAKKPHLLMRKGLTFTGTPKGPLIHAAVRTGLTPPTPNTCAILITWMPVEGAEGYLLYRDGEALTPTKLTKAADPATILKTSGEEWESIAHTLAISTPSQFFASNLMDPDHPQQVKVDRENLRWTLAQMHANAAVVMGVGFIDASPKLKSGKTYTYAVKYVKGGATKDYETIQVPCTDTRAALGTMEPAQCSHFTGDQYLELLWPRSPQPGLAGYDLYRAVGSTGTFQKVNRSPLVSVFWKPGSALAPGALIDPLFARPLDAQGQLKQEAAEITSPAGAKHPYGFFVDQTLLKSELSLPPGSDPVPPEVVYERKNGVTVRYKVVARDMFGPAQMPSQSLSLEPQDLLPPAQPAKLGFSIIESEWQLSLDQNPVPCLCSLGSCTNTECCLHNFLQPELKRKSATGLRVAWTMLARNINNCPEELDSYVLYRYPSRNAALADDAAQRIEVGQVKIPQGNVLQSLLKHVDDASLPGDVVHWYRLKALDRAGHASFSGPYSASLPDQVPPLAPRKVQSVPVDDASKFIAVAWETSRDALDPAKLCADVASYRIYRRVCGAEPSKTSERQLGWKDDLFRLVGEVNAQTLTFKDTKLPLMDNPIASTLCYEYCVRAVDKAGNASIDTGGNTTCQRLTKIQGPKAPTITSLTSRTGAVRLDWVAPPVPDLYTFRIYRAEKPLKLEDPAWGEPINDAPVFAAQVPCEATPPEGFPYAKGLTPAQAGKPPMHEGKEVNSYWYVDTKQVQPNRKYWYKIVSVDYWKNPFMDPQASIAASSSPVMSTFTYGRQDFPSVAVNAPEFDAKRGVELAWGAAPVPDVTYLVYRRNKDSLLPDFVPLATGLSDPHFLDRTARPGQTYLYAVQYLTADQHYSSLSAPVEVHIPTDSTLILKPGIDPQELPKP
jgi:hypothetical protein